MQSRRWKSSIFRALRASFVIGWALLLSGCMGAVAHETAATWPEPTLPDTAAGRQFGAFLAIFTTGDEEALKGFVADHFTPIGPGGADLQARTKSQLRLRNASHGLNVYAMTDSQEVAVTVTAQLRLTQEWKSITFKVEYAPPHRVSAFIIQPVEAPVIAGAVAASDEQLQQQIDAYMRALVDVDRFSGVVLIAKDGTTLFEEAYRLANKEQHIPNQVGQPRFGSLRACQWHAPCKRLYGRVALATA
jgi:hypothetical protein